MSFGISLVVPWLRPSLPSHAGGVCFILVVEAKIITMPCCKAMQHHLECISLLFLIPVLALSVQHVYPLLHGRPQDATGPLGVAVQLGCFVSLPDFILQSE